MKILKPRESKTLNPRLGGRLLTYAAVAGASAACAPSVVAEIIYTPVHSGLDFRYSLDLNNDGTADFKIGSAFSVHGSFLASLRVQPAQPGNFIAAEPGNCSYFHTGAAALPAGVIIGPDLSFRAAHATCMAIWRNGFYSGLWLALKNRYLGLSFLIDGKVHYGWARLSVENFYCYECLARIQGYAYETEPDKPIRAGDEGKSEEAVIAPHSLGMLALGAPGLELWREDVH